MKALYILIIALMTLSSCISLKKSEKSSFDALLGNWERREGDSRFVESWTKINSQHYKGSSFEIVAGDTVFAESVELIKKDADTYYIVSFPGTDAPAVSFKLISDNPWTFENRENDFPQRIVYQRPTGDSLHAHIEGTYKGSFQKIDFKMRRDK